MVRYFIDTEFCERGHGKPIDLISIGIVAEDGREYYAVNASFKTRHANPWVKANVLPKLPKRNVSQLDGPRLQNEAMLWKPYDLIAQQIVRFIDDDNAPEFWGWCCDFDYVVVSQLIGFNRWPSAWPYYFRDLQQVIDEGRRDISEVERTGNHTAIEDAREMKRIWEYLAEANP